eukprot:jgi/Tetstr1/422704/TSEL_013501.t1
MYHSLMKEIKRSDNKPLRKMYFLLDNTTRENKNKYVLAFSERALEIGMPGGGISTPTSTWSALVTLTPVHGWEYNANHLHYHHPKERNFVICIVDAAGDGGERGWAYRDEDVPYLLGEWERSHCVGRVYHIIDVDNSASGQHELELKLFEPRVLQSDIGKPDEPLWVASRDVGVTLSTARSAERNMVWLPITGLPIDHFEYFYNNFGPYPFHSGPGCARKWLATTS